MPPIVKATGRVVDEYAQEDQYLSQLTVLLITAFAA
jgi:hypothetical protein